MRRAKMRINFIERIKQLSLNIWKTNVASELILKEVNYTNDKLDELEEKLLNKINFLYFKLIEKESKDEENKDEENKEEESKDKEM